MSQDMVDSIGSSKTSQAIAVALLKKTLDVQEIQGQAALELLDSTKIDSAPGKGRRIDTVA